MQTLQAAIMGVFQGLTEFLPVSSSGHIVLTSALYKLLTGASFNMVTNEEIFFDILIHLATLFAVIIYFFKDLKAIITGFFKALFKKDFLSEDFKFVIYIIISTFITCLVAFFVKDVAHKLTQSPFVVSILLIFTGSILFLSEKFKSGDKKISLKTAMIIGLFQGLAVFPGISRSGMTIASAIFNGINRVKAAKFSFILSIPIIMLASLIYPVLTFDFTEVKNFDFKAIITGMVASFVVGYFCIKYFMKFLEKRGLKVFAYYCWAVGAIFAFVFFLN